MYSAHRLVSRQIDRTSAAVRRAHHLDARQLLGVKRQAVLARRAARKEPTALHQRRLGPLSCARRVRSLSPTCLPRTDADLWFLAQSERTLLVAWRSSTLTGVSLDSTVRAETGCACAAVELILSALSVRFCDCVCVCGWRRCGWARNPQIDHIKNGHHRYVLFCFSSLICARTTESAILTDA